MSDLSPTEKLLVQELASIKADLKVLREHVEKDEPRPRMLPVGLYTHVMSPKAGVKAPAPAGDEKFAGMASIYGKEKANG